MMLRFFKPDGTSFSRSDVYDYGNQEYVHDTITDSMNNIIIAASSDTGPGIDVTMIIAKFDIYGNQIWVYENKLDSDSVSIPKALAVDEDNNIYVAGFTDDNGFLKKLASDGSEDSTLDIRVPAGNDGNGFLDLKILDDDTFLLSGMYSEVDQSTLSQKWLVQLDQNGDVLVNKKYDGEANSYGYFVEVQKNNNRIICAGTEKTVLQISNFIPSLSPT